MNGPYVPPATAAKLNGSHPVGTRHQAMIDIAMSLLGNGLSENAVAIELRSKFDEEKTDKEIRDVVEWCAARNPTPSGFGERPTGKPFKAGPKPKPKADPLPPDEQAKRLIRGASAPETDWLGSSPVKIPDDYREHAPLLIRTLYSEGENLCGHADFGEDGARVYPKGGGVIRPRQAWLDRIADKGMFQSPAGCWWRMNPVKPTGSGTKGAPTDDDVTAFRFALVEHDKFEMPLQLALLAKMQEAGLSIAALILTGGKSVHAWAKLDATDADDYAAKMARLLAVTEPLGFDGNRNPSRLARIPGVKRTLGAKGDGLQRLLYLNPNPPPIDFARFEARIQPIQGLVSGTDLVERVREFMRPRKADFTLEFLAGPTPELGFYFRPAELTLWSGITGHGKSSLLAQLMVELISYGSPIFVSSLEHKPEQICELFSRVAMERPPTEKEAVAFLNKLGGRFHFADTVGEIESDELFRLMRASWQRHGSKHFFIDSLMRVRGLEEDYPAQLNFVNELQAFCKESGGHIHLVAHPRKMDETTRVRKMDVKGSSAIPNNVDNVLTIRRNVQKQEADENGKPIHGMHDAEVAIEKQRATGWQGVVKLSFNPDSRTFKRFHSHTNTEHRNYHHD